MREKVNVKYVVYPVSLHFAFYRYFVTILTGAVVNHAEAEKGQSQRLCNERSKSSTWCFHKSWLRGLVIVEGRTLSIITILPRFLIFRYQNEAI